MPSPAFEIIPTDLLSGPNIHAYLIGRNISQDFQPTDTYVCITATQLGCLNATNDGLDHFVIVLNDGGYLGLLTRLDAALQPQL